jgi:predicted HTH domain antitoxin
LHFPLNTVILKKEEKMVITIPESVEQALRIPVKSKEKELKKLLALKLYEKGILGMGKARELLGASRLEFMYILKEEGIPLNYDQEELEHDIKTIEGM